MFVSAIGKKNEDFDDPEPKCCHLQSDGYCRQRLASGAKLKEYLCRVHVHFKFLHTDCKVNMLIVESLTCECTPGKTYPNKSSLKRHCQTQRHLEHSKRNEERQLRVRLAEVECRCAKLEHDYKLISDYLRYPNRRQVTTRMKKDVAARAKWKCEICNFMVNANYEVDHITPLYHAGDNSMDNLQCLCPDCHRTKTAHDRRK